MNQLRIRSRAQYPFHRNVWNDNDLRGYILLLEKVHKSVATDGAIMQFSIVSIAIDCEDQLRFHL